MTHTKLGEYGDNVYMSPVEGKTSWMIVEC